MTQIFTLCLYFHLSSMFEYYFHLWFRSTFYSQKEKVNKGVSLGLPFQKLHFSTKMDHISTVAKVYIRTLNLLDHVSILTDITCLGGVYYLFRHYTELKACCPWRWSFVIRSNSSKALFVVIWEISKKVKKGMAALCSKQK